MNKKLEKILKESCKEKPCDSDTMDFGEPDGVLCMGFEPGVACSHKMEKAFAAGQDYKDVFCHEYQCKNRSVFCAEHAMKFRDIPVLNIEEIALVVSSQNTGWILLKKSELEEIKEQAEQNGRQEVFDALHEEFSKRKYDSGQPYQYENAINFIWGLKEKFGCK